MHCCNGETTKRVVQIACQNGNQKQTNNAKNIKTMKNFGKQYDSLTPIFYAIPSQGITGTTRIIGTTRGYTGVAVIIETETFGFVHIKKADYNEAN